MKNSPRARAAQLAELSLSIGLAILLVVSAVAFGRIAIEFGIDAFSGILHDGLQNGIKHLANKLQSIAQNDLSNSLSDAFGDGNFRLNLALFYSAIAALLAPIIYAGLWLSLARFTLVRFTRGIWGLMPRDDEDAEPGPLPEISRINALLEAEDFQSSRLTQEDRALLGRHARHTPLVFVKLQRSLRVPVMRVLQPVLRVLFWGALTVAFLLGILLTVSGSWSLLRPAAVQIASDFAPSFSFPLLALLAVLIGLGIVSMLLDIGFARALAPKQKPVANKDMEMLRDLTVNMTPEQFNSVLKSELSMRLKPAAYRTVGLDGNRDGFVDQSSFVLEILVEGGSKGESNFAAGAATKRLWVGVVLVLIGAAIPLFFLLPSDLRELMQSKSFSLLSASSAPVWMLLALAAGRSINRMGRRAMDSAETVLLSDWHKTPIVSIRLDGTMNTQTALTGRAVGDSYGSENRIQQSRFDARLMSTTLITAAASSEAPREIFAFDGETESLTLQNGIAALLCDEGKKSTFSAVEATVAENQAISEAAELRKAELKLQIEKTQAELKRLESGSNE